jgi:hypothetical protein
MRHTKRKTKPGPKPVADGITPAQRHDVMLAAAGGMALESIASALDVSRRTLSRAFAHELAVGRAKKMLENLKRLERAADQGNVSAQKFLHTLMAGRREPDESVAEDRWAAVAGRIQADIDGENLPKKSEFN